jgi:hypothetical protein
MKIKDVIFIYLLSKKKVLMSLNPDVLISKTHITLDSKKLIYSLFSIRPTKQSINLGWSFELGTN